MQLPLNLLLKVVKIFETLICELWLDEELYFYFLQKGLIALKNGTLVCNQHEYCLEKQGDKTIANICVGKL